MYSELIPIGLAWICPQDHSGKVSCRNSIVDVPIGRARAFRSKHCPFWLNFGYVVPETKYTQNLWNSLDLIIIAWLHPMFHEIRWSVFGENHRYQPRTTALYWSLSPINSDRWRANARHLWFLNSDAIGVMGPMLVTLGRCCPSLLGFSYIVML